MNILLLTTHLDTGGITRYVLAMANGLRKADHRVWIVSGGGERENDPAAWGYRVQPVRKNIRTKSELDPKIFAAVPSLGRLIHEQGIQVVHAQTRVTQVMGALLGHWGGVPYISTCHGFFRRRFGRRMFPAWGERVIAISEAVRRHLRDDFGVAPERIRLIPNGIDVREFPVLDTEEKKRLRARYQLNDEPIVGSVARLSFVKGMDVLIRAMKDVVRKFPLAKLLLVGTGREEANLRRLTEDLGLRGNVQFHAVVNKTAEMLSLFDVFVMPSRQEGLGLSVMEAQAAAVPVVASRVGGLASLIEEGRTGLLVGPEDPEGLARQIIYLLENKDKARHLGLTAREFVAGHFSEDKMVSETIKVYAEVIRK